MSKSLWNLKFSEVMDVHAYATSPTTFMRKTSMLMNGCVLLQ